MHKVLSAQDTFVLSKHEWEKFCENKYSIKIRKMHSLPPQFALSECIQIRKTNKIDLANCQNIKFSNQAARYRLANKVGFVLGVDVKPITRAAKGSRVYQILLTGEVSPIYAHESDLKRRSRCQKK